MSSKKGGRAISLLPFYHIPQPKFNNLSQFNLYHLPSPAILPLSSSSSPILSLVLTEIEIPIESLEQRTASGEIARRSCLVNAKKDGEISPPYGTTINHREHPQRSSEPTRCEDCRSPCSTRHSLHGGRQTCCIRQKPAECFHDYMPPRVRKMLGRFTVQNGVKN